MLFIHNIQRINYSNVLQNKLTITAGLKDIVICTITLGVRSSPILNVIAV